MDVKIFEKKRLPSRPVMRVPEQAPRRSCDYSMGLSEDQINQPFVGGVSFWREAAAGKISWRRTARAVKTRVADSAPREFCTAAATGGVAKSHLRMKSSQVFNEVVADSIDVSKRGRCCDATAGIAVCDKSLTGVMMAGVRLNVPSIFMYRSSILTGRVKGRGGTAAGVFEADGQNSVVNASDGDRVSSDTGNGQLELNGLAGLSTGRRAEWRPRQTDYWSGAWCKQAQQVGSARLESVTHPGAKSEVIVYADQ